MTTQVTPFTRVAGLTEGSARDIVLIHGLWMTSLCWENWVKRFTAHGYHVIAPSWPGIEGRSVPEVRKDPRDLEGLGLEEIVIHYERVVRGCKKPPIIMGHSFGGLITQLILNRGYGAAGIALHSTQTKGVKRLPLSSLKVAWPALKNPFNGNNLVQLTPEEFHYAFTNHLSSEDSLPIFDRYCIPGPTRPFHQAVFANFNPNAVTEVDYESKIRPPLLFISGGKDHAVPASVNKENAFKYKTSTTTDYREFPDRTHFTLEQEGWEEVADLCLEWAAEQTEMEESNAILH